LSAAVVPAHDLWKKDENSLEKCERGISNLRFSIIIHELISMNIWVQLLPSTVPDCNNALPSPNIIYLYFLH